MLQELLKRHVEGELAAGVEAVCVDGAIFESDVMPVLQRSFPAPFAVTPEGMWSSPERERFSELDGWTKGAARLRGMFRHEGRIVGGFALDQEPFARLYMMVTAIAPELRGRGVYGAYVERVIAFAREAGFREIFSHHLANNNAVLVPKLSRGFTISGFEVNPRHGLTVRLGYWLSENVRSLGALRAGDLEQLPGLIERGVVRLPRSDAD